MDIKDIKVFLRIDHDEEDELIQSLIKSGEEYLENAGCKTNYDSELYNLAVKMLISHWYENRGLIGSVDFIKYSLESIIYQLRETNLEGDVNVDK